jgi:hypothetical protein
MCLGVSKTIYFFLAMFKSLGIYPRCDASDDLSFIKTTDRCSATHFSTYNEVTTVQVPVLLLPKTTI